MRSLCLSLFLVSVLIFSCASTDTVELLGKEYYNLGNAYLDLKKFPEASRSFKNALKYNPQLKLASFNLSRVYAELGDFPSALAEVESLLRQDPDNLSVLKMKAWLLYKQGEKARSAELWSTLAEKLPGEADTQYNAGVVLSSVGKNEQAVAVLNKWRDLDGKTAPALKLLADLQVKLERWDEAEKTYRQILSTLPDSDPQVSRIYQKIAEVKLSQKLYGEAVESYQKAISVLQGESPGAIYFQIAQIQLEKMEDYDGAWKSVQDAIKNGFRDAKTWDDYLKTSPSKSKEKLAIDLRDSRLLQPTPSPTASPSASVSATLAPSPTPSPSPSTSPSILLPPTPRPEPSP